VCVFWIRRELCCLLGYRRYRYSQCTAHLFVCLDSCSVVWLFSCLSFGRLVIFCCCIDVVFLLKLLASCILFEFWTQFSLVNALPVYEHTTPETNIEYMLQRRHRKQLTLTVHQFHQQSKQKPKHTKQKHRKFQRLIKTINTKGLYLSC